MTQVFKAGDAGTTQTVTIGTGGTGGVGATSTGTAGGNGGGGTSTTFGTTLNPPPLVGCHLHIPLVQYSLSVSFVLNGCD